MRVVVLRDGVERARGRHGRFHSDAVFDLPKPNGMPPALAFPAEPARHDVTGNVEPLPVERLQVLLKINRHGWVLGLRESARP
jgi:hypothetical protein